jgi:hypothetical protein
MNWAGSRPDRTGLAQPGGSWVHGGKKKRGLTRGAHRSGIESVSGEASSPARRNTRARATGRRAATGSSPGRVAAVARVSKRRRSFSSSTSSRRQLAGGSGTPGTGGALGARPLRGARTRGRWSLGPCLGGRGR